MEFYYIFMKATTCHETEQTGQKIDFPKDVIVIIMVVTFGRREYVIV